MWISELEALIPKLYNPIFSTLPGGFQSGFIDFNSLAASFLQKIAETSQSAKMAVIKCKFSADTHPAHNPTQGKEYDYEKLSLPKRLTTE